MPVSPKRASFKRHIQAEVDSFFARHEPRETCLVLDSTGPAATKHYLVLAAIGLERLRQLREIHAFSGGAFAYFGYHALSQGKTNYPLTALVEGHSEAAVRRFHHPSRLSPVRALSRLLLNKTAFGTTAPLINTLDFIFAPEHLDKRLSDFPSNLTIYLGAKGQQLPVAVSARTSSGPAADGRQLHDLTVRELVTLATTVPFVYGARDRSNEFFDAAFTPGYRRTLRALVRQEYPVLVSTPWRPDTRGRITYLNCYGHDHQKLRMSIDFARLLLNLPNRDWGEDIEAAFL